MVELDVVVAYSEVVPDASLVETTEIGLEEALVVIDMAFNGLASSAG